MRTAIGLAIVVTLGACATRSPARAPSPVAHPVQDLDDAEPSGAPKEELPWAELSAATFARAKAEGKFVVMDGAAEWCHWCHVMEATTYHDPEVRSLLDAHFIAAKVDVDARPDVQERYADWGWPATVIFSPDGAELGKYRGYIAPADFVEVLRQVVASGARTAKAPADGIAARVRGPLSEEQLASIERFTVTELADKYDDVEGGWGNIQKAPLAANNAWLLSNAERNVGDAKKKAIFTLDKQSALLDPVWGGIYQYSAASHWNEPHFEKLMTFQAGALDNYATAFRLTANPTYVRHAEAQWGYLERFMRSPEGGFYTTQDADLNAHDRTKPFMDGHAYYALGERERLARGIPRIDTHEYGKENGLAIAAYVTFYEATRRLGVLEEAERAARRILATHLAPKGAVTHDALPPSSPAKVLYLADNAAFGLGLMRLHEATKKEEYLRAARAIADFMLTDLADRDGGGLFASTPDPDAIGVFATRRIPFEDNAVALRVLARLARQTKDPRYAEGIRRILSAISTEEQIKDRGRLLGDYLLALEETKGVR